MKASENRASDHGVLLCGVVVHSVGWNALVDPLVRPRLVDVMAVLTKHVQQVLLRQNHDVVEARSEDRAAVVRAHVEGEFRRYIECGIAIVKAVLRTA